MKEFEVGVEYKSWGTIKVKAESEDALLIKLKDATFIMDLPLPCNPEYVEDSFEIDEAYIVEVAE